MSYLDDQHQKMVAELTKPGADILRELTSEQTHLMHMAIGIAGEAGELLDAIKKHVIYNKKLDMENIIEELGDIEFHMQGLRRPLNITREETLVQNVTKLSIRYAEHKYSDQSAQNRADKAHQETN